MKLAPSVVAAHLIGGTAIHIFFGFDIDCNSSLENGTISRPQSFVKQMCLSVMSSLCWTFSFFEQQTEGR